MIGNKIYNLAKKIWSYNRSLTGNGNRETLKIKQALYERVLEFIDGFELDKFQNSQSQVPVHRPNPMMPECVL